MDWKDIGKIIGPLAPTLGGIIGGLIPFPGGAFVGTALGNIVARQLGVEPTPQAVGDKLAQMSHEEKLAALNAATERARIEVDGFKEAERQYFETVRAAIGETGQSWRLELLPENRHPYYTGWRPAAGWVFVFYAVVFGAILMYALALDGAMMDRINASWPTLIGFFGLLAAMVGVAIFTRPEKPEIKQPPVPPKPPAKK